VTAEQITNSRLRGSMDKHSNNAPLLWFDVWFVMSYDIMGIEGVLWRGHHVDCGLCHPYAAVSTKGLRLILSLTPTEEMASKPSPSPLASFSEGFFLALAILGMMCVYESSINCILSGLPRGWLII
jgi:hypothetical protein